MAPALPANITRLNVSIGNTVDFSAAMPAISNKIAIFPKKNNILRRDVALKLIPPRILWTDLDSSFTKFPPFVYKAGQYHLDIGFTAFPIRKLGWTHRSSCTSRNLPCAVFLRAYGHLSSSVCKDRLEHL